MSAHNNYEVYEEAKCDLGLVDIVNAFDYIQALIHHVPQGNKLREYYETQRNISNKILSQIYVDVNPIKVWSCGLSVGLSNICYSDDK